MWFFAYFPELSDREPTSYKTLGLHVMHSLRMMPSNDLMSFFLALVDRPLVHLFFRPDSVHISLGIKFCLHLNHIYRTLRVICPLLVPLVEYLFQEVALPFHLRWLHPLLVYKLNFLIFGPTSLVINTSFQLYLLCLLCN